MELSSLKRYVPYVGLLLIFGFGIWLILAIGSRIYSDHLTPVSAVESPAVGLSRQSQKLSQHPAAAISSHYRYDTSGGETVSKN